MAALVGATIPAMTARAMRAERMVFMAVLLGLRALHQ
jgi:hypothetical protein